MSQEEQKLNAALDLMRRLPPSKVESNLSFLVALVPEISEDLLSNVDAPLKVATCEKTGKPYLLCDYNRDGDSYRSPWSNEYSPILEDGIKPNERMRALEVKANDLFSEYFKQYYDKTCIPSCYFWQEDENEFSCYILVKKEAKGERGVETGVWDATHAVRVTEGAGSEVTYTLISTVLLSLSMKLNNTDLSGSVQKQETRTLPKPKMDEEHLVNIGNLIQDVENMMWDNLNIVYFAKTKEITSNLRSMQELSTKENQNKLLGALRDQFKK